MPGVPIRSAAWRPRRRAVTVAVTEAVADRRRSEPEGLRVSTLEAYGSRTRPDLALA
jgi:hypothetical protein